MTASMLDVAFGLSATISDMNGDGWNDVVRASGTTILPGTSGGAGGIVSVAWNNPANPGFFPSSLYQQQVGSGAPYHHDVGDLNNDGRPDMIMSDDASDKHRYNLGNDSLGRATWGALKSFAFAAGGDDGFAGTNHIADIDGDGWNDAVIADFDVDVFNCGRRGRVYHNPGVGAEPTLKEEVQQSGTGGWKGVVGMGDLDQRGTFDIAVFDIDNDGDNDMVWGRCAGAFVWMNQKFNCPESYSYGTAVANSDGTAGSIALSGSTSLLANDMVLTGTGFPANKTCLFLYGTTRLWTPVTFGNGLRWVGGSIQRLPVFTTDASGQVNFNADFTTAPLNSLNAGDVRNFQLWYRDPLAGGAAYNASDALEITFCP
jgi:hypothetical protein